MKPKVTIGMITFNDAVHVQQSISSFLAQTYQNYRLIVCDDHSHDETQNIILKLAKSDNRIEYHFNTQRIGMVANYRKVFQLAPRDSDYFAWAAGHDLYQPDWLAKLVEGLSHQHNAVLSYSQNDVIDDVGNRISKDLFHFSTSGLSLDDRITELKYFGINFGGMIYGLFRYSALTKLYPFPRTFIPDVVFIYGLSLLGEISQISEILWSRRYSHSRPSILTIKRQQKSLFVNAPFYSIVPYQLINTVFLLWHTCLKYSVYTKRKYGLALSLAFLIRYSIRAEKEYYLFGKTTNLLLRMFGRTEIFRLTRLNRKLSMKIEYLNNKIVQQKMQASLRKEKLDAIKILQLTRLNRKLSMKLEYLNNKIVQQKMRDSQLKEKLAAIVMKGSM